MERLRAPVRVMLVERGGDPDAAGAPTTGAGLLGAAIARVTAVARREGPRIEAPPCDAAGAAARGTRHVVTTAVIHSSSSLPSSWGSVCPCPREVARQ